MGNKANKLATLIFILLTSLAQATQSDILTPPPAIEYSPWIQVARTEEYGEFRETFPSAVQTPFSANNLVPLQVFVPTQTVGKPPVVILLHFWGATDNLLEREFAQELAVRGIASVIMPLPYHLDRTPPGYRSGELAIVPDTDRLRQTMVQSISDLRRTLDWIQTRPELDSERIGVTGTSLGAIVASLAFAVEPRIKSAGFILGGADLAYLMMNSSRTISARSALRSSGYTEESLRNELAPIEPLTYLQPGDSRPSYSITARYDTVVPRESSDRLQAALGNVRTLELDTGHFGGFLVKTRILRTMAAFFDATLRGREYDPPTKFYSPTIRMAVLADRFAGLQVGAGLDIWRSNSRGDSFVAAFLTPRGPQGYVGFQLGNGVSVGAMFSRFGTSPGLVWSTVF